MIRLSKIRSRPPGAKWLLSLGIVISLAGTLGIGFLAGHTATSRASSQHQTPAPETNWTLAQAKQSLTIVNDEHTLPATPSYKGNVRNLMVVMEHDAGKYMVINGENNQILGSIPASSSPHTVCFNPVNHRYMYGIGRDGWLYKDDLYSLKVVRKVRVGLSSRGIAISSDGKWVAVSNYSPGSVTIVNADTLQPAKIIPTYAIDPNGNVVHSWAASLHDTPVKPYFLVALKQAGHVWEINWAATDKNGQHTFPVVHDIPNVGAILHDGFETNDGKYYMIASQGSDLIGVIRVADGKLIARIHTPSAPHTGPGAVWTTSDGRTLCASNSITEGKITVWDTQDWKVVKVVQTPGPGLFIRSDPHSEYVWADCMVSQHNQDVVVFDKNTLQLVTKGAAKDGIIKVGPQALHPEFTFDGNEVYVAEWMGNAIKVYNSKTLQLIATIHGPITPTGIFNVGYRLEEPGQS